VRGPADGRWQQEASKNKSTSYAHDHVCFWIVINSALLSSACSCRPFILEIVFGSFKKNTRYCIQITVQCIILPQWTFFLFHLCSPTMYIEKNLVHRSKLPCYFSGTLVRFGIWPVLILQKWNNSFFFSFRFPHQPCTLRTFYAYTEASMPCYFFWDAATS
jgi:hypothetical protein